MKPGDKPAGRSVARSDFEAIIRRAVELAHVQGDIDESVSEAELVRIGAELGIPAAQVKQALYEQPQLDADPRWYDRYYEKPIISASRVLGGTPESTIRKLEEYISAREYMQLVRRKPDELAFIPAEDAISRLARGLSRPGSRYHLAHARRVIVSVQPIGEGRSHVRLDSDFSEQRASNAAGAVAVGSIAGLIVGVIPAASMAAGLDLAVGAEILISATAWAGTVAGSVALAIKLGASQFRNRLQLARREIDGLLDRAEHSDRLEPPPAPWRRSLAARFFGTQKP